MKRITITLIALAACTPDVPANPSFQQDVLPILAANCIRCHSTPAIGGAPEVVIPQTRARFPAHRFDALGDIVVREALPATDPLCTQPNPDERCSPIVVAGAASMASRAAVRVADDDAPMPPRFQLADHQIEILQAWEASGAERGEPRPDNALPSAAVKAIEPSGSVFQISVRVDDPDHDLVGGSLHARIAGVDTFIGLVQSGLASMTWDAIGIADGTYTLFGRLDDGGAEVVVELGTITVGGP